MNGLGIGQYTDGRARVLDMRAKPMPRRDRAGFSGTVYLNGSKHTGLTSDPSKPWVKVLIDGSAAPSEQLGPPSDPFPPGEEWYEKANTYGDIHVIGTR